MHISRHVELLLLLLSLAMPVVCYIAAASRGEGARSRPWIWLVALPGVVSTAAFYSLALHMYQRLGEWPRSMGTHMLPPELVTHFEIAGGAFTFAAILAMVLPLVLMVFALVPRLRAQIAYPALCGITVWAGLLSTFLAPSGFLSWWWD